MVGTSPEKANTMAANAAALGIVQAGTGTAFG
jgi:hypothetical protein